MYVTDEMLRKMMPNAGARLTPHLTYINRSMIDGNINTPKRVAAFLAQVAHESGEYRYTEEIWGPTEQQLGYEGRPDLGNIYPGDGYKFRGFGAIQTTGRTNQTAACKYLGIPVEDHGKLRTPEYATGSAVYFWNSRVVSMNKLAERGWFRVITHIVNGGENGLLDRVMRYQRNLGLLGQAPYSFEAEDAAIRQFQRENNLVVDGDAGPATYRALVRIDGRP